ncbi:hypothetical protein HanRHA438_Chr12g0554231 [Helianthus annuus]|nr:hypothetical protein HanRHA438_Chr12g0554231 [Helianthus annuus]
MIALSLMQNTAKLNRLYFYHLFSLNLSQNSVVLDFAIGMIFSIDDLIALFQFTNLLLNSIL